MSALPAVVASDLLQPEHRAHLHAAGLDDATVAAARLRTVDEREARALGYAHGVAGLCFPYPGCEVVVDGRRLPYTRIRVDRPREPGRRYENPLKARLAEGLAFYPYVPAEVAALRKEPRHLVVLTEGEKKALALTQVGWPAIGLPGVFLFTDPTTDAPAAKRPLHPELRRWAWRGREVLVCFDSDRLLKDGVGLACERLCHALTGEGALVRVVEMPTLPHLDKTGADDFLVAEGVEAFAHLVQAAEPWRPHAWLIDRVPRGIPTEALPAALGDLGRLLRDASSEERCALGERLRERFDLDAASTAALVAADDGPLPQVVVSGRQARDLVTESWRVLRASRFGGRLFRYGGALVRVTDDEEPIESLDPVKLTGLLLRAADWVREEDGQTRPSRVPADIARDMVALPPRELPRLVGITPLPVLRRDGSVLALHGFDRESGLYCRAAPVELPDVTPEARKVALALLRDELLGDFPFARDSDRAHALALLLLPVVRHLVKGPTPLHLVEAPSEGTGKTLLADVVHVVATGHTVDPTTLPGREEETRKKLTALLMCSPAMILLDNVDRSIDSAALASALTKERWADRLLGQSTVVRLPNRAVWVATGNNPTLSRELARRCCRIRLDAGVERPWLRDGFRHPDLVAWAVGNRARLVAAALTLARGWLADGAPLGPNTLGSFNAWAGVLGGILGSAGVEGFLTDRDEPVETTSPDEELWQAFVARWAEEHSRAEVDGRDLHALAVETGLWAPDPRGGASDLARFGIALARRRDRVFGDWRLAVRRDGKRKQNVYALIPVESENHRHRLGNSP